MINITEIIVRSVLIGAGATLVMDAWAALLRQLGIPSLNMACLGRWIGHMPSGQWFHEAIAKAAPVRRERLIGWFAHYAIGIGFAALLLARFGLEWARSPTLFPALFIGVATILAPWLVLQPALGAGVASCNTPAPFFNAMKSLVTHIVFGVGLFLAARATGALLS